MITRDTKQINAIVNRAIKASNAANLLLHTAAVTTLVAAAEGGVQALNNLFKGMVPNYRKALRIYVGLIQDNWMAGRDDKGKVKRDADNNVENPCTWIEFKKGEFALIKATPEQRKRFVAFAEKHLEEISKQYPPFYSLDNTRGDLITYLFDSTLVEDVKKIVAKYKKAQKGELKHYAALFSSKLLTSLEAATVDLERIAEQEGAKARLKDKATNTETIVPPKAKEKAKA